MKQQTRRNVLYWVFTGLFSLLMGLSCLSDLFRVDQAVAIMFHLGFPLYLIRFMGVAKLFGLMALLTTSPSKIKEWAYAGFAFNLIGGFYAHLCLNDRASEWARPLLLLILLIGSYAFWDRKRRFDSVKGYSAPVRPGIQP